MKSIKCLVLLVFIIVLTVPSCKKDDATKSRKEMLLAKLWKFPTVKLNGIPMPVDDCIKDDFFSFAAGGTYTYYVNSI
jgi:hypothetical protein